MLTSRNRWIAPGVALRHNQDGFEPWWKWMPMKRLQFIAVCWLWGWLVSLGVFGLPGLLWGASREADWKKVDEAVQKGLPKTAIEALEPIIAGALRDQAY